jgi:hypothetical protein
MNKFIFTILILSSLLTPVLAEDINVSDLLGDTQNIDTQEVAQQEEQRLEDIQNELSISVPEYTDNPSHIITFIDPSEEKVGVELDIDEKGYKVISSPYALPSLNIGEHSLKFRFTDSIGATKLLEYETIIIPRPPIVKAPTFDNSFLNVSGTGLANSEILVTVSVGSTNFSEISDIDSEGDWSITIPLETDIDGIYTIFAYTRKNGYASNPSEPSVLAYGEEGAITVSQYKDGEKEIAFSFSNISLEDLPSILSSNPDLIILSVGFLLIGFLVSIILLTLFRKASEDGVNKEYLKKFNKKSDNTQEKTLKELFSDKNDEKDVKEVKISKKEQRKIAKEEKQKKEDIDKEKVFSKKDFLKDFKNFDPDTNKGDESKEPSKKDKKDVIVSLTSKSS